MSSGWCEVESHFVCFLDLVNTVYSEIGIGIVANIILLFFHISLCFTRHRPKPTDLPIGLLALIHLVMLLIIGFMAVDIFTPQGRRWGDLICKLLIYLYRLFRVFSICTTCLLSVLQAMIISPRNSCLKKFKHKSSHRNLFFLLFLCVINSFFGSHLLISIIVTRNLTSDNLIYITESCSLLLMNVFLIGLMALLCGYMVILLCKHKRECQHLHSITLSPKASPEQRATRTILLLMSFFMLMYCLDCIFFYFRTMQNKGTVFHSISMMVANGYVTISPFIFICSANVDLLKCLWGRRVNV
uniref:Vomeronasal type-1 receptor n=1 Tax=Sciurus vulgaris TaxID=55149 RepID=A0A8D2CZ07_SCIVU